MVNGGRAGYLGMECEDRGGQNILPYVIDLLGPFGEIWEYARKLPGNSQGEKCARVWKPSSFPLAQFYGVRTVLSVLQLVSHIYSIKANSC